MKTWPLYPVIYKDQRDVVTAQIRSGIRAAGESRHGPGKGALQPERKCLGWMACGIVLLGVITLCGCEALGIHETASLVVPSFRRSEIAGIVAGFGTTFAAVPDLVKMFKRRSSKGLNPTMAGIMCVFQIVWVYYGLLIASRPVIAWNAVAVIINFMTVGAYLRFARSEKE
jgi:MtN3 and saliva related transmembrane protein